jgi:hypothetical protein
MPQPPSHPKMPHSLPGDGGPPPIGGGGDIPGGQPNRKQSQDPHPVQPGPPDSVLGREPPGGGPITMGDGGPIFTDTVAWGWIVTT